MHTHTTRTHTPTVILQRRVSRRLPLTSLVVAHIVDSLVFVPIMLGMLFFLFEFFSDHVVGFSVLTIVWEAELFSVVW